MTRSSNKVFLYMLAAAILVAVLSVVTTARANGNHDNGGDVDVSTQVDVDSPSVSVEGAQLTVEGDVYEAPDVKSAAYISGKARVKHGLLHAETAPRPARALSERCDTAGATLQTGPAGGGFSAPTFPCEVMRTKQALSTLDEGGFDYYVTRPLLHVRLVFKGMWSVLPVIGN